MKFPKGRAGLAAYFLEESSFLITSSAMIPTTISRQLPRIVSRTVCVHGISKDRGRGQYQC